MVRLTRLGAGAAARAPASGPCNRHMRTIRQFEALERVVGRSAAPVAGTASFRSVRHIQPTPCESQQWKPRFTSNECSCLCHHDDVDSEDWRHDRLGMRWEPEPEPTLYRYPNWRRR